LTHSEHSKYAFSAKDRNTHFYIGLRYLGALEYQTAGPNSSDMFFCPKCNQVWGKRHDVTVGEDSHIWAFVVRACEEHGDGSLLLPDEIRYDWVDELPMDLLRRELQLIFDDMTKKEKEDAGTN
tara:strand:- start:3413 stop:3784 length:372 start_codon:yes stop_codon:yes gene_type:complete